MYNTFLINNNKNNTMNEHLHLEKSYKGIKLYIGSNRAIVLAGKDIVLDSKYNECNTWFERAKKKMEHDGRARASS